MFTYRTTLVYTTQTPSHKRNRRGHTHTHTHAYTHAHTHTHTHTHTNKRTYTYSVAVKRRKGVPTGRDECVPEGLCEQNKEHIQAVVPCLRTHLLPPLRLSAKTRGGPTLKHMLQALYLLCNGI